MAPTAQEYAEHWASELDGTDYATSDLPVDEGTPPLTDLLERRPIRAYHCTRLLSYETDDIRANGLAALDGQLIDRRLARAYAAGNLTKDERDQLNVTAVRVDSVGKRLGQVCLIIGRQVFDDRPHQVRRLLETWGGEAIYGEVTDEALRDRIENLGRPSIVVLRMDLTAPEVPHHLVAPDLRKVFVGAYLGLQDAHCGLHYHGSIAAADIETIWQPGHEEYDQHPYLPS